MVPRAAPDTFAASTKNPPDRHPERYALPEVLGATVGFCRGGTVWGYLGPSRDAGGQVTGHRFVLHDPPTSGDSPLCALGADEVRDFLRGIPSPTFRYGHPCLLAAVPPHLPVFEADLPELQIREGRIA